MAPEMLAKKRYGAGVDIWSLYVAVLDYFIDVLVNNAALKMHVAYNLHVGVLRWSFC